MSDHAHDAHSGSINTPRQRLGSAFFSFVLPLLLQQGLRLAQPGVDDAGLDQVGGAARRAA